MLAEAGKSKVVAFDEIDKAPEEKARGITIATAHGKPSKVGPALWTIVHVTYIITYNHMYMIERV